MGVDVEEVARFAGADAAHVEFQDRLHGRSGGVVDDFVVARNDGAPAYNLAVVVDDAEQGIGEVVRGDDLLDSTPRQILLYRALGLEDRIPTYCHLPLVIGPDGRRLRWTRSYRTCTRKLPASNRLGDRDALSVRGGGAG